MPYGNSAMAPILEAHFRKVRPSRVLDIGIGYGFWGAMLRNYFGSGLDGSLGIAEEWGEAWVPHPGLTITGIEPFWNYDNPMWKFYDGGVVRRNVADILPGVLQSCETEFVVCIDVMEHLPREVGMAIFNATKKGVFGICTQMYDTPQAPYGNNFEDHITEYAVGDFTGPGVIVTPLNDLYFSVVVDR